MDTETRQSPQQEAAAALAATSDADLLQKFGYLTHRIHEATTSDHETELRGMRLLVQNEVLRRMGGRA